MRDNFNSNPPYPHLKRIARVEQQRGLGVDVRGAGDAGDDLGSVLAVRAFEDAAEDALLSPDGSGGQLAIGGEAGQLGTGAGSAR